MIVLDASAAVEWLLETTVGMRVAARILSAGETIHAPHLLDLEVAQALRKLADDVRPARGRGALQDLLDLPIKRYPHEPFLWRVWSLRHSLTPYDAIYIAIAEELEAPLVTCDEAIASAPGHHAQVEVI